MSGTETTSATISDCGRYRYDLVRRWGPGPIALWVMLNPSTADATVDDPTIRRVRGFTRREGLDGFCVVNLFALRATDPRELLRHEEPVGSENAQRISEWMFNHEVDLLVAAWGNGTPRNQPLKIPAPNIGMLAKSAGRLPQCLGKTKGGHPRHPLYVKADEPLVSFP